MKPEVTMIITALGFGLVVVSASAWFSCYVISKAQTMINGLLGMFEHDPPVVLGRHWVAARSIANKYGLNYDITQDIQDAIAREHAATKTEAVQ